MSLKTRKEDKSIVVYLEGRMDVHLSAEIENELNKIISEDSRSNVILDLSKVEYMSSSGLRIFVATMRQLKETGRSLKLCSLNYAVKKVFEVVELMDMFDIYEDEKAAVQS